MTEPLCPELAHLKVALYHLEKRPEEVFMFLNAEIRKVIPMLEEDVRKQLEERD